MFNSSRSDPGAAAAGTTAPLPPHPQPKPPSTSAPGTPPAPASSSIAAPDANSHVWFDQYSGLLNNLPDPVQKEKLRPKRLADTEQQAMATRFAGPVMRTSGLNDDGRSYRLDVEVGRALHLDTKTLEASLHTAPNALAAASATWCGLSARALAAAPAFLSGCAACCNYVKNDVAMRSAAPVCHCMRVDQPGVVPSFPIKQLV